MQARASVLPAPDGPRYWVVNLVGKGEHHFRHPYYGVAAAITILSGKHYIDPEVDTRSAQEKVMSILPYAGMTIGACWHHRAVTLTTPFPIGDLSDESLRRYGEAVAEELQDAEYTMLDIMDLFNAVMPEFVRRQSLVAQAEERVRFTRAPAEV